MVCVWHSCMDQTPTVVKAMISEVLYCCTCITGREQVCCQVCSKYEQNTATPGIYTPDRYIQVYRYTVYSIHTWSTTLIIFCRGQQVMYLKQNKNYGVGGIHLHVSQWLAGMSGLRWGDCQLWHTNTFLLVSGYTGTSPQFYTSHVYYYFNLYLHVVGKHR